MLTVPGYVATQRLGDPHASRIWRGHAESDGHAVVLRRSPVSGIVARDALRTAVARLAGLPSGNVIVPSSVVTTPEGLVLVYDADITAVWDGTSRLTDPRAPDVVADGVAELHSAGLVHGALIAEAVWVDANGQVRLACLPGADDRTVDDDRLDLARFLARLVSATPGERPEMSTARGVPSDLASRLAPYVRDHEADATADAGPPAHSDPAVADRATSTPAAAPAVVTPEVGGALGAHVPDDVLRAPAPNRPLMRVEAAAAAATARWWARPGLIIGAAVVLSGVAVAGVIQLASPVSSASADAPGGGEPTATADVTAIARTPPPVPTPASAASTPAPAPADPWRTLLQNLDAARAEAFATGNRRTLDTVYVADSAARTIDAAALRQLQRQGLRARGLTLTTEAVTVLDETDKSARLRVIDRLSDHELVDADGHVVRTTSGRGARTWIVAVRQTDDGWRIANITAE